MGSDHVGTTLQPGEAYFEDPTLALEHTYNCGEVPYVICPIIGRIKNIKQSKCQTGMQCHMRAAPHYVKQQTHRSLAGTMAMRSAQVVIDLAEAWKAEEDAGRQNSDQNALNQVPFALPSRVAACGAVIAVRTILMHHVTASSGR